VTGTKFAWLKALSSSARTRIVALPFNLNFFSRLMSADQYVGQVSTRLPSPHFPGPKL
jgi:hypothetical protein